MKTRSLTKAQKAARIGVSAAHYRSVACHQSKPSYDLARKMAKLEGVHFLHLLDHEHYDERGKRVKSAVADSEPRDA